MDCWFRVHSRGIFSELNEGEEGLVKITTIISFNYDTCKNLVDKKFYQLDF